MFYRQHEGSKIFKDWNQSRNTSEEWDIWQRRSVSLKIRRPHVHYRIHISIVKSVLSHNTTVRFTRGVLNIMLTSELRFSRWSLSNSFLSLKLCFLSLTCVLLCAFNL
jgi:hypothetical protein